jgi:hypothetical protein
MNRLSTSTLTVLTVADHQGGQHQARIGDPPHSRMSGFGSFTTVAAKALHQ